eukprot:PhM_4_TR2234/c0_g1_i1/m.70939
MSQPNSKQPHSNHVTKTLRPLLESMPTHTPVNHYTNVNDEMWRDVVTTLARKMHLMELEMQKQSEEIVALREEVAAMRVPHKLETVQNQYLQHDVATLRDDVQTLKKTTQKQYHHHQGGGLRTDEGTSSGLTILSVAAGSPADGASLRVGDVVMRVNGRAVRSREDLFSALENHNNSSLRMSGSDGDAVEIVYCRSTGEGPFSTWMSV